MGGKWKSRPEGAKSEKERNQTYRRKLIETGRSPSLFDRGEFVAVDGEGFSEGPDLTFDVDGKVYQTRAHSYAFLAASDGSELYSPTRLMTHECLDFLLDIKINNPNAILVTFGASYDMTHMLADVGRDDLEKLLHGDGTLSANRRVEVTLNGFDYRIEVRPRKQLSVWRWPAGFPKYEDYMTKTGDIKCRLTPCDKVTLWDVWGFFQGSFVGAMEEWLPGDPDHAFIRRMKGDRVDFQRSELPEIRDYNMAELRCLCAMMERLRGALRAVGARISRWDGAGAVAAALLREHGVHEAMATPPAEVRQAARHAYAGGHIEAMKVGRHIEEVHHYDISSAYPAEAVHLPDLANGEWRHGGDGSMRDIGDVPDGFVLARVSWRFEPGLPFYPLFWRDEHGSIMFPERGHGWYWLPEVRAAQAFVKQYGCIEFHIHEFHQFVEHTRHKPFAWVKEIFSYRQTLAMEAKRSGVPDGRTIAIKLGLNALYGKLAQQVGARREKGGWRLPRYFQFEWAGWITSGCRAKLMLAGMQKPDAVICMATDGIFTTEPLDLDCPDTKTLGAWEYKCHQGMTIVMPGVYWTGPAGREPGRHYSRGFDKDKMRDQQFILDAWKRGKEVIAAPSRRMITLGQALTSETFWKMRGCFVETTRRIRLDGFNSKRVGLSMSQVKPHRRLEPVAPQDLFGVAYNTPLEKLLSAAYPVIWLDGGTDGRPPIDPAHEAEQAASHA